MALCGICSATPFSSLPNAPNHTTCSLLADKEDMPELWYNDPTLVLEDSALGYPWHENMDTLAASAKFCPLCGFLQKGVQSWLDLYEDALRNDKYFREFHQRDSPIPTGQQLWLTKRSGGAPGFIVLVWSGKSGRAYVLTGVSFGIEAGMCSTRWIQYPGEPLDQHFPNESAHELGLRLIPEPRGCGNMVK